jgi:hypothetical protein
MVRRSLPYPIIAAVVAAALLPAALGQVHLEIQPFVGCKFGGKLHPGGDDPNLPSARIQSSHVLGVSATVTGVETGKGMWGAEFMWNSQPTSLTPGSVKKSGIGPNIFGTKCSIPPYS